MSYINEYASKSSHSNIIKDEFVRNDLKKYQLPRKADEIPIEDKITFELENIDNNPIQHIVTVDGGYTRISVKKEFPSSTISFFQFGLLSFSIADLNNLKVKPFISPKDMRKLKDINRLKFTIPTKNVKLKGNETLTSSIRNTIFDFFRQVPEEEETFIETLNWFIFREYSSDYSKSTYKLSRCPHCWKKDINLDKTQMIDYKFICTSCGEEIYLTDVFRLHEAVDDEVGAGDILGNLTTALEQIFLIHLIRIIIKENPALLKKILFIKDGPLAFFGHIANMFSPMRDLVNYLFENHELYMVGVEKSGPFPEHAHEISSIMNPNSILLLSNNYIYKYVLPGKPNPNRPYGDSTYYGNKLIFKSKEEKMYIVTLPTEKNFFSPTKENFRNIEIILNNLSKLKCDMYANSLIPIALVNQLVSLSDHPSSLILEKFAREQIK